MAGGARARWRAFSAGADFPCGASVPRWARIRCARPWTATTRPFRQSEAFMRQQPVELDKSRLSSGMAGKAEDPNSPAQTETKGASESPPLGPAEPLTPEQQQELDERV